jgi:hypothetical protein
VRRSLDSYKWAVWAVLAAGLVREQAVAAPGLDSR